MPLTRARVYKPVIFHFKLLVICVTLRLQAGLIYIIIKLEYPKMIAWHENKFAPKPGTILCKPTEIENGAAREFRFGGDSPFAFRMFVYNDAGNFKGFHNSCPHFDVPMNHTPEELFTPDGEYFQCVTHYAKFDKSSGICVYGPCEGKSLQRIPLTMEANNLKIGTA